MSNLFRDPTTPVARRAHRCTACAYPIAAGERYFRQTGFFDGDAFTNKLHTECADSLAREACELGGTYEFIPGEIEPPERLRAAAEGDASHG